MNSIRAVIQFQQYNSIFNQYYCRQILLLKKKLCSLIKNYMSDFNLSV